ncbi:MAG: hypothetical protein RR273_06845, partial [Oscillospiraceae bacterium]
APANVGFGRWDAQRCFAPANGGVTPMSLPPRCRGGCPRPLVLRPCRPLVLRIFPHIKLCL